jgi:hypothetical protein
MTPEVTKTVLYFYITVCWSSLPGKSAGQVCRASLPGKSAGQVCRASLPGKSHATKLNFKKTTHPLPVIPPQNIKQNYFLKTQKQLLYIVYNYRFTCTFWWDDRQRASQSILHF